MPLWNPSVVYLSSTALVAQSPDSATTGGNARGANAVDWQTTRASANQVASGTSATIGGGASNLANNTAATVGGGILNNANAINATVAGGSTNTASGVASVIGGGYLNTSSGQFGWVPGGYQASTRGIYGRGAWASGGIAATGDAQSGEHVLRRQTTGATPQRLTTDNGAGGAANQIILPNFSTYSGTLTVVSKAAGSMDSATWRVQVSATRGNGAGTLVIYEGAITTPTPPTASNGTGSTWLLAIAADTVNGAIAISVTGAAATTINHAARFANVEVVTAS